MKFKFTKEKYQLDAIQSVIDIFEGQPISNHEVDLSYNSTMSSLSFSEKGIGNNLVISKEQVLVNIQKVQERNKLTVSEKLEPTLSSDSKKVYTELNFSIEMETGTGKTYTFLRTIYELNKTYGFKKFVIVVPSVAIREGTIKNLQITHEHFQSEYDSIPINYTMYDSKNLSSLRNFATSNAIQILVINIDSFTKSSNIINTKRESGVKPIEYIQSTNPIVIIDEPQNFETDKRHSAIKKLNPLCRIGYSATHKKLYNLIYSLNPVQAYDMGLVKQIEVDGITAEKNSNLAYVKLVGFDMGKRDVKAILVIHVRSLFDTKEKKVQVKVGDDLYDLSGGNDHYKGGFIINKISSKYNQIEFSDGTLLGLNQELGNNEEEIMKFQIERTIRHHFAKEEQFLYRRFGYERVKVISLIFIDKVANYRQYEDGKQIKGKFALWFEEIFNKLIPAHREKCLSLFSQLPEGFDKSEWANSTDILDPFFKGEKVHGGYFSQDRKGNFKDTKGTTKADEDTYSLIMKDKEKLLSFDEPIRFLFSHSALREGWDNPNVFQICTLNETKSTLKKRQEIGRGLRLPVDEEGNRIKDKRINMLTVIANESYDDFSKSLQKEMQDETSVDFGERIQNANEKVKIKLNKELTRENAPELFELWDKVSHQTTYSVDFDSQDLIDNVAEAIGEKIRFAPRPLLESRTTKIEKMYSNQGISGAFKGKVQEVELKETQASSYKVPNVYKYIQERIDITKNTIYKILTDEKCKKRVQELLPTNPQAFLEAVVKEIESQYRKLLMKGNSVTYTMNGKRYDMTLFKNEEIETYLSKVFEVSNFEKTPYTHIPLDNSNVERSFAEECEKDPNVRFYLKLPRGFKIATPVGNYTPDWAVTLEKDKRVYFVAETKGSLSEEFLREIEQMKVKCGEKHFASFKNPLVHYDTAVKLKDVYKSLQGKI